MKNKLEIDSVFKYYDHQTILSDVYLKCETGDIMGILGRNGTGKSTLLKIIYGILSADNKFIRINNKVRKKAYLYKNEISYLSQDNFIPTYFNVSKAVRLFLNKDKVLNFKKDTFIQQIYDKKISSLSSGELRYLEIKLILSNDSKFALLDEPYNGISPLLVKKVNNLITESSAHKGIILTDHSYKNVLSVSTQIYLIKDCAIKKLKNKEELIRFGYLKEGMF